MRVLSGFFVAQNTTFRAALYLEENAYDQSTYSQRTPEGVGEIEVTGADQLSPAARRLRSSDDAYAEEAEFRVA
jgi:hypothetical protein